MRTNNTKQRTTHQRQVILEVLKRDHSHPSADKVYEEVRKRLPNVSLGTVYRNLDTLSTSGMITKLQPERTQMRFDGNTKPHYHLSCTRCGAIEDVFIEPKADLLQTVETALGKLTKYGIFGHKLEFFGLCSRCQEKSNDP